MSLKLRNGKPEDVDGMVEVYLSAFENDLISRQVFPRQSGTGAAFWRSLLADEFTEHAHFLVITDLLSFSPETVIGFAKWVAPGAPVEDAPPPDVWPADGNRDVAVRFFEALTEGHKNTMGSKPHWYLEMVAVRQGWKGKGAGGQMLKWGLDKADEEGKPIYLDATPQAKGMYEKYGFRVVDQRIIETPEGDAVAPFMVRKPKSQ